MSVRTKQPYFDIAKEVDLGFNPKTKSPGVFYFGKDTWGTVEN